MPRTLQPTKIVKGQKDPNADKKIFLIPAQTKSSLRRQKAPDESIESFHSKQSGSSQTLTDKLDLSYKRDLISKQINHQEPDLEVDFWVEDDIDSSTSLPNQDLKEESESAEVEIDTSIETDLVFYRSFDKTGMSIAPRPWLIEEKLDRKFVDWLAQKWAVKYGDNLHTARSNVLRHFKKDEQNIIIAWSEYSAEYIDRYKNTQTRLASGLEISQSEQRHLIENQAALTKPIPSELSPVSELRDTTQNSTLAKKLPPEAEVNESQEISNVSVNDHTTRNKHSIDWDKLPEKEDLPENFAAYGQWQPAEIDKPADRSQVQDFLKSLCKKFSL